MDWTRKVKATLVSFIVPACALPALSLNVWPRIENMIISGLSSQELGIVLLVSISALGMTAVPFAMAKAPNAGFWWFCLIFGLALGTLNYMMAVGAIGKAHDGTISGVLAQQAKRNNLEYRIKEAMEHRRQLGEFRFTTSDMLASADLAIKLALEARDQECGRVGDFCRARQAQLSTRQEERAQLAASAAITARAERIDVDLARLGDELQRLGYVPAESDPQAARIARVVGLFITLEPKDHVRVADFIISFLAIFAEALALGMPRIILTALQKPVEIVSFVPPPPHLIAPSAQKKAIAVAPSSTATNLPSAGTPPVPSLPPPAKKKLQQGDPLQWLSVGVSKSPGRLRTWDAYTAYKSWCKTINLPAAEFITFDMIIKSTGIQTLTEGNKTYYLNSSLTSNRPNLRLVI